MGVHDQMTRREALALMATAGASCLIATGMVQGCSQGPSTGTGDQTTSSAAKASGGADASLPSGAAADEVLTLQAVDQTRTLITVRTEYNVDDSHMEAALEEHFPDLDFVFTLHNSPNTYFELRQSLSSDTPEDIIISPNMMAISDIASQTLVDLSAESFTDAYRGSSLDACQVDGKLYYLPGPSNIYGIIYDATLFDQNGWSIPTGYTEFLSLVDTIDATGIRAFQPTCKYARQAQMVFTAFDYDETFVGVDNYAWLVEYQNGTTTMEGHMEPAFTRYDELHDHGVIEAEDFDMQPGNRSAMMYTDHSCAMIIENQMAATFAQQAGSDHTFAMMPFWCGDEAASDLLVTLPNYYIGIPKRLEADQDRLATVKEVLAWLSTAEGQLAVAGGTLTTFSSIEGVDMDVDDFNAGIQDTVGKGNVVSEVNLMASGNGNAAEIALQSGLRSYLEGSMTAQEVMASCDTARDGALANGFDYGTKVGEATTDFTRLQTGLYVADILRNKAGADVGLCIVGQVDCGEVGRIYAGDITDKSVSQLSLSVGKTNDSGDDKKLWKLSMTGADLKGLLARPYTEINTDSAWNQPYFVASGLKITFAPWADTAAKLQSVTLEDGSPVNDDDTYSVGMWCWPFTEDCTYTVDQVFDDVDTDLITAAIEEDSPLSPIEDGRFVLDWSVVA